MATTHDHRSAEKTAAEMEPPSGGDRLGHLIQHRLDQNSAITAQSNEVLHYGGWQGDTDSVHQTAAEGVSGAGGSLPHLDAIQHSFGRHDVSGVKAHTDAAADKANSAMGSKGYATGNAVAFKGSPDLHTAAHEAAHVVQQRGGVQLKGGVGQQNDVYERHADAVADKVVAGESAEALLDPMARGGGTSAVQHMADVQFKAALGNFEYQSGTKGDKLSIPVHSRSVAEWKTFLENDADERNGSIELNAFMARAVGQSKMSCMPWYNVTANLSGIKQPTEAQAVDLMEAYLTVGGNIDLADKPGEGSVVSRHAQGPLMATFNTRFAAKAILRITKRGEMGQTDVDAIKAYAEDAADMHGIANANQTDSKGRYQYAGKGTPDPNQRLIASALGTAVGGAQKVYDVGSQNGSNAAKHEAFNLIANGGRIIAACLEQAREDKATQKTVIMTLFKAAAGAVGAATGGTAAVVVGALTPVAEEFLSASLGGGGKKAAGALRDKFIKAIDQLVTTNGMDANDARLAKNTFIISAKV